MKSEVDRELAKLEERAGEARRDDGPGARGGGIWATLKRLARDLALRRVSTRR